MKWTERDYTGVDFRSIHRLIEESRPRRSLELLKNSSESTLRNSEASTISRIHITHRLSKCGNPKVHLSVLHYNTKAAKNVNYSPIFCELSLCCSDFTKSAEDELSIMAQVRLIMSSLLNSLKFPYYFYRHHEKGSGTL